MTYKNGQGTMSRINDIERRISEATPGPWDRPLNTRFKSVVTAPLPDDEPSDWKDRIPSDGVPERVVVAQCQVWSNGRHNRKRSGRDLELIAHAPEDLADLVAYAKAANDLLAEMLEIYSNGVQFDQNDPKVTYLDIAQRRGWALEEISDRILDFTDHPVSRNLELEEI